MKLAIAITAFLLYPLSYQLCELFFPDIKDIDNWDVLRHSLYIINMGLFCSLNLMPTGKNEKLIKIICYTFLWWVLFTTLIDYAMGDFDFHWWDIIFIGLGFYFGKKKYDIG